MTISEMIVVGFFTLLFAGTSAFLTASYNTQVEARANAVPVFVEVQDFAQYGFRGTFGGDL